jgi:hypothetical protein
MAALDFPAAPTLNQTYVAPNGVTYQWNGTIWVTAYAPTGMVAFRTGTPNALSLPQWTLRQPTFSATPLFNNGGGLWDGTTYTVKTAGLYMLVFQSGVAYPAAGSLTIGQGESFIYVNGAVAAKHGYNDPFWAGPFTQSRTLVHNAYLAVNDLITLRILTGNIDGVNLSADSAYTWLSAIRLGS